MRLFVGIPLSAQTRSELENVAARTAATLEGWRWTSPESWHITLQFLGNADQETCAQLIQHLRPIRSPAVRIELGRLDLFERVGALFVDVGLTPELIALQQRIVKATAWCGFCSETRPYHPHITLGRSKGERRAGRPKRDLPIVRGELPEPRSLPPFEATEFLLYESFLGPSGSRYEIRERFSLD